MWHMTEFRATEFAEYSNLKQMPPLAPARGRPSKCNEFHLAVITYTVRSVFACSLFIATLNHDP